MKQIDAVDSAGKIITRIEADRDSLVLRFSDGTFAYIEAVRELGDTYLDTDAHFRPATFDVATLERLDILTPELMAGRKALQAERDAEAEAEARAEYERLRAQFEEKP